VFRVLQIFKPDEPDTYITSLDFDDTGELVILCRTDDTMHIYNVKEGKYAKPIYSQKYGCHLARFTHHSQSIVHASTKGDGMLLRS
jgi:COMPASS component SWD2